MMKHNSTIKEYAQFFFATLGIMFTIYLGYIILSPYIMTVTLPVPDLISVYLIAILFTLSRFILCSDWLTLKMNFKVRLLLGIIPAAIAVGILSYDIGLQNLLFSFYEGKSKGTATFIFAVLVLTSFAVLFLIWFAVNRKLQKLAIEYNTALDKYKIKQLHVEK